jgi:hypothetical protein
MSLTSLPAELVLLVIAFLNTRDVFLLGRTCRRFHAIAEDERARRDDISWLLSRYVDNQEHFRCLMRDTGAIIVGDFARACFTGQDPQEAEAEPELDLLFGNDDIDRCLDSWASFLGIDVIDISRSAVIPVYERYRRCEVSSTCRRQIRFQTVYSKLTRTRTLRCLATNCTERPEEHLFGGCSF